MENLITISNRKLWVLVRHLYIVNPDLRDNSIIELLAILTLGEQLALFVRAKTEGKNLQQNNQDINNDKFIEYL